MNKKFILIILFLFVVSFVNAVTDGIVLDSFASPGSMPVGLAWNANLVDSDTTQGVMWIDPITKTILDSKNILNSFGITYAVSAYWITDYNNQKIYRYVYEDDNITKTLNLNFKPFGITYYEGIYFFVSDYDNGIIYKINNLGKINDSISPGINSITDLVWDGEYLWVASCDSNKIYKLDINGNILNSFDSIESCPYGLTYDGVNLWSSFKNSNNIYKLQVNHAPKINRVSPAKTLNISESFSRIFSINATDSDSDSLTYYWYLNNELVKVSKNRNFTLNINKTFGPGINNLRAEVTDGQLNDSTEWNIGITDLNFAPIRGICYPLSNSTTNIEVYNDEYYIAINSSGSIIENKTGNNIKFSCMINDPEQDNLVMDWYVYKNGVNIFSRHDELPYSRWKNINYTFDELGTYTVNVSVQDDQYNKLSYITKNRQWKIKVICVPRTEIPGNGIDEDCNGVDMKVSGTVSTSLYELYHTNVQYFVSAVLDSSVLTGDTSTAGYYETFSNTPGTAYIKFLKPGFVTQTSTNFANMVGSIIKDAVLQPDDVIAGSVNGTIRDKNPPFNPLNNIQLNVINSVTNEKIQKLNSGNGIYKIIGLPSSVITGDKYNITVDGCTILGGTNIIITAGNNVPKNIFVGCST